MPQHTTIRSLTAGLVALATSCVAFAAPVVTPDPPKVNAKGYVLVDYLTGRTLVEHNADGRLAPASLTKMMTSYVIGTEIKNGNVTEQDMVKIGPNASLYTNAELRGSSLMFVQVDTEVPLGELNKGIIVVSGNDACIAVAEHLAGTEDAFADMMNAYAEHLGMSGSHFMNSHGLDHPEHYTTPRDMATLGVSLIRDLPEEYAIYKEKSYTWDGREQFNRNALLWDKDLGADGIKTGHTNEAGYSLVSSAVKGDMRLVAVVMGTDSTRARNAENRKLLQYGFRFFETVVPYDPGTVFAEERVWFGTQESVELGVLETVATTLPKGQRKNLKADFELTSRPEAPVTKGQEFGVVHVTLDGEDIATYPLVALHDVEEAGWMSKLIDHILLFIHNLTS
ncbi:D-alanyl-D-alanine carboxypeptidase [Neiella marina]|uniref:serine-type D-Ala-D-Ala carboxypeptidase n=1 Tax=Neiella holothuriorum TaxID=2870530 RepID=A0ABS7EEF8_9GAMM|nr:D-alanyl-D-alanine carboxypeptidase family protein [Neiella holothuriorum]MBW8190722.1 D-alanyl-D-alanine carboxypeptidase [Neiella holothuriorum]